MADEETAGSVENVVENIGIDTWQQGLARAVNETYSYANNSLFYAMLPTYYRDYAWRYIRVACQWLDGYVCALHQSGISGIISTRIGSKLITGLTKQIIGEKLIFKLNDRTIDDPHDTLNFVAKWYEQQNIIKSVYAGIGFALGVGTSCIKMNVSIDNKGKQQIWWDAVRFDNCYYLATFKNEVKDATFIIRNYTDTREGHSKDQFFLVEHRYYKYYNKPDIIKKLDGTFDVIHAKGDRVPMVEYNVHRVHGTAQNNIMPATAKSPSVNWSEIPQDIRDMIKQEYSTLRIGEPQELPFTTLGVQPLLNGELDLSVPTGTNFGESMLVGIQDDLLTYEIASSYLIRDMYLGKGTLYLPKSLSINDVLNPTGAVGGVINNPYGNSAIEMMKGVSPEEQQAIVQQFEVRANEWQTIKENALKNISVKWGMSPKILAAFLTSGQAAMTATQIDSEDDSCIAFIYHTRSYFKNALNKLLEETLNFYGYPTNVTIDFASPSLINKDRLLDRIIKERQEGLIDTEEAIRTLNPDLDEETLQRKIDIAKVQEQQMAMAQFDEMNADGTFGNPGQEGQELDGSTFIQ